MNKKLMPIDSIPDWEMRIRRQDAFWSREIIDRPVVIMAFGKKNLPPPPPPRKQKSPREIWMDNEHFIELVSFNVENSVFAGDALPFTYPNLGPEVFSAFFGMELEFSETTSWGVPNLHDWSQVGKLKFSRDNFYWKKIIERTDALIEAGRGKFYVGYTDLHPGGDAIAAFRDPLNLNIDMIDFPEEVRKLRGYVDDVFEEVFGFYMDKLQGAGQAITSWPGIVSSRRWHVASNDFSCMISKKMFDDIFLPGLERECRIAEASIYHLDGPQALTHLDSLLEIKELDAIQWVYGASRGRTTDWFDVHKKCQAAGKGIQIYAFLDEIDAIIENLRPEGVWLKIHDVGDEETAAAVLKKISRWK